MRRTKRVASVAQIMLKTRLYQIAKRWTDAAARAANKALPAWQAVGEELRPATPPASPTLPINLADLPAAVAAHFHETTELPARHLFRLRNVSVSWHAVVFRNFRLYRKALPHPREEQLYLDAYLLKQWAGPHAPGPGPADGYAALVHDQWTGANYYHWMADALPRLLLLRQVRPNCPLVMPAPIAAHARTTAVLLGFTQLLAVPAGHILRVPCLLLPEHTAPPGFQDPALIRQLRDELTAGLLQGRPRPTPRRRVYVSRNRQALRRLANEADVLDLLQQHGFETVFFEELSFEQQALLLLETAVLLGVHGANLTNMLFMQPGTTVVELINAEKLVTLQNRDFENLIYYRMASNLGLRYANVPCAPVQAGGVTNDDDVRVAPAFLGDLLATLG